MTWNYRIIHHDDHEHPYYGLHEVYYYENDNSISTWTVDATVVGDDADEIISSLKMMLKDAESKPILVHSFINKRTFTPTAYDADLPEE